MRSRRGFDLAMAAAARRAAFELRHPPPPTSSATRSMAGRGGRVPFPRGRRARARAASATRLPESGSEPSSSPRPRRWFASGLRRSSGTPRQREQSRSPGGRRRHRPDPRRSLFLRGHDVPTELSRAPVLPPWLRTRSPAEADVSVTSDVERPACTSRPGGGAASTLMSGRLSADCRLRFGGWAIPNAPVSVSSSNACATGPGKRRLPSARATRAVRSVGVGEVQGWSRRRIRALTGHERRRWPRTTRLCGGCCGAIRRSAGRCCVTSSTPRRPRWRPSERGWSVRAGVLGCWRCGLVMACGRTGPAFRVPRCSQRPRHGLWLPVSHRRLSRRRSRNRPRHRPSGRVPSRASRGPRRTRSCSTCATWAYLRTVR